MTFATFGSPVHPGGILRNVIIPATGMDEAAFAGRLGVSPADLVPVLEQTAPLTAALALRVGRLLGAGGAPFWLRVQASHDLAVAAATMADDLDRIRPLEPDEVVDVDAAA